MGNEGSRPSPLRRSMSRRQSKANHNNNAHQYIAEDEVDRNQDNIITQSPKPLKRMDKIRRSLSFRKKKKSSDDGRKKLSSQTSNDISTVNTSQPSSHLPSSISAPVSIAKQKETASSTGAAKTTNVVKPTTWIEDEKKVRAGNCSFQVKYLGTIEVSDSRGMHLCESAIERLLAEKEKKKPIKAILYVSGDSLRVVDESNKTLLVDQTIEKVSFCAPDRHHENGFAYICRDGTTRRWLCYCFMAIKDTLKGTSSTGGSNSSGGERLSHAVGCAFSVCLEKKQRREKENVSMEVGPNHSFARLGSFRQASLTERLEDPQMVMPAALPVPIKQVANPHAIERPKANPDAFTRQNSLRGTAGLQLPFKRGAAGYTSLRPGELPSFQQQKVNSGLNVSNIQQQQTQPVTKTSLLMQQHQLNNTMTFSNTQSITNSDQNQNKINTISELPEESQQVTSSQTVLNNTKPADTTPTNQQLNWSNLNNVYPTPQSIPATPQAETKVQNSQTSPVTPPPLPPMPSQNTTPQFQNQQQNKPTFNVQAAAPAAVNNLPLQQQFNLMSMTPNQMAYTASPSYTSTMSQQQHQYHTPTSNSAPHANETFEQKWARIQAAKNTNPFAEDIAKKFEIKLT